MFILGFILSILFSVLISDASSASDCSPLPEPNDGHIKYNPSSSQATYENGTIAVLMCDLNRKKGPMYTTCVSGYWDPPELAKCEQKGPKRRSCKDIKHGPESNITYSITNAKGRHPHLSTASKECINGTVVLGPSYATCVGGKWVPSYFGECGKKI
ncbi:hypothetical protein Y032_0542g3215 [Ancylostoma ceylanicum]|uniref:Sushi domain-containing protein n=1 Tax=Ancylostoma ceylanicum TaxID=53326 RepID=A0A016WS75_9BILA|nr:hypothetical protein Y032_0542g3215 [Ancylostoma ceylanicum]